MASGQVIPAIGDDVTALMNGSGVPSLPSRPPIGADVTHLMTPTPDLASTNEKDASGNAVVRGVTGALPAIGGVIGGIAGGVPGAILGGAAGKGYQDLVRHASELPGAVADIVRNVREQGLGPTVAGAVQGVGGGMQNARGAGIVQGAFQGAGDVVGAGLIAGTSKTAPWLMNKALNLTDKLSREFPNLAQTMIDHSLTVSRGGLSQARTILRAAKAQVNAALSTARQAGATVPIEAATDGLMNTLPKVLNSSDIEGGLAALAKVERKITAGRGATMNPYEADMLKTSLQTESKGLYAAEKMGTGPPQVSVQAQAKADMAASLNQKIAEITTAAGHDGYREGNGIAQEMIGAVRGINKGTRSGSNLYTAMVRPGVGAVLGGVTGAETGGTKGAAVGTLVGTALTSPVGMSRLAVAMSKPAVKSLLRGAPKLSAAIAAVLASEAMQEP